MNASLVQGGKWYVVEAVAYEERERWFARLLQRMIHPFWRFVMPGCKAGNLFARSLIRDAGFEVSGLEILRIPSAPFIVDEALVGVALKP